MKYFFRLLFNAIWILACVPSFLSAQQIVKSEGGQNIQIFTKELYYIISEDSGLPDSSRVTESEIPHWLTEINIIEAEYFVQIYTGQKELDALYTNWKQAKKTNNTEELERSKKTLDDFRSKYKDLEGLYGNSLSYKKLADKLYENGYSGDTKKLNKLTDYIQSKDYMFKTISNREKQRPEMVLTPKMNVPDKTEVVSENDHLQNTSETIKKEKETKTITKTCSVMSEQRVGYIEYKHPFSHLFAYSPERLKSLLKDDDLVKAETRIRYDKKNYVLDIKIILRSKDAAKSYGLIPEGNLVRLEFVNGLRLNLKTREIILGRLEEYSGKVIYEFSFLLDKEMLKQLESMPVDNVGVMWSTGFEKYTIYEIDTFMRQILCFKSIIH